MSTQPKDIPPEEHAWIEAYVNETISKEEFAAFEARLATSAQLRAELRQYLALDSNLRESVEAGQSQSGWALEDSPQAQKTNPKPSLVLWWPVAAAAAAAFFLGIGAMTWLATPEPPEKITKVITPLPEELEPQATGFAVVHHLEMNADAQSEASHLTGDTLEKGRFTLPSGTAELHFFCGARMIVEGPADLEIHSGWEAVCHDGNLRIQVPPAARGFKVTTPGSEIIDLGTEFGLEVRNGNATVEVLDGEIAVQHGSEKKQLLTSGQRRFLPKDGASAKPTGERLSVPDPTEAAGQFTANRKAAFQRWQQHSQTFAKDNRLIAYYNFQNQNTPGILQNLANGGDPELRGAAIMAEPVAGRWGRDKGAMEFRRPGSRVRVHAAGEFSAFTFASWVRIDSLDHWYNALFMADSYETGEPHWQIDEKGRLMLSVMVDDSVTHNSNTNSVRGRGRHLIYFSPVIWDQTKSGEWIHLASTYDPKNRTVAHYVNGKQVSSQAIKDKFFIDALRIGNGEIGNWGQPFGHNKPTFAIRNLNGRIDELAILNAALSPKEIQALYEASR